MKKVKFYAYFLPNATVEEETMEYDDDVTSSEIDADFEDWKANLLDTHWWEIDEDDAK